MLGFLLAATAQAQPYAVPEVSMDGRTARTQAKVESLYKRGDYARAHFIYLNELAPRGDKYAQYMAGYMYLIGLGVEENPVLASAWYRLAAERGTPEFLSVRDKLLSGMSDEQLLRSDEAYLVLRENYSDLVIVLQKYEEELAELHGRVTGSRLSNSSGIVTIVDPRTGSTVSLDDYRRRIETRLRSHLDFISKKIGGEPLRTELSADELADLRRRISEYLKIVDDR